MMSRSAALPVPRRSPSSRSGSVPQLAVPLLRRATTTHAHGRLGEIGQDALTIPPYDAPQTHAHTRTLPSVCRLSLRLMRLTTPPYDAPQTHARMHGGVDCRSHVGQVRPVRSHHLEAQRRRGRRGVRQGLPDRPSRRHRGRRRVEVGLHEQSAHLPVAGACRRPLAAAVVGIMPVLAAVDSRRRSRSSSMTLSFVVVARVTPSLESSAGLATSFAFVVDDVVFRRRRARGALARVQCRTRDVVRVRRQ